MVSAATVMCISKQAPSASEMYLAAESLGLRATGIGAFYDDQVHHYLNLTPEQGQVVYHFAIGYPIADPRLEG